MTNFIISIIAVSLIALFFFLEYVVYGLVFRGLKAKNTPHRHFGDGSNDSEIDRMIKKLHERECEEIFITSYDGKQLMARFYKGRDDAPLNICCHGYRGGGRRDFCAMGNYLIDKGDNVILIQHRAHRGSQGRTICYGVKERYDVQSWVKYAAERFGKDKPVYLWGISMGAATVLMSSSLPFEGNVRAILADCPFSSPKKIIKYVTRDLRLPENILYPVIWLSGVIYGNVFVSSTTAAKEVKRSQIPMLIIHGEADSFVPCYMSEEIQKANPDLIERHTFKGADHGLSYFADKERYLSIVEDFIKRHP